MGATTTYAAAATSPTAKSAAFVRRVTRGTASSDKGSRAEAGAEGDPQAPEREASGGEAPDRPPMANLSMKYKVRKYKVGVRRRSA